MDNINRNVWFLTVPHIFIDLLGITCFTLHQFLQITWRFFFHAENYLDLRSITLELLIHLFVCVHERMCLLTHVCASAHVLMRVSVCNCMCGHVWKVCMYVFFEDMWEHVHVWAM